MEKKFIAGGASCGMGDRITDWMQDFKEGLDNNIRHN